MIKTTFAKEVVVVNVVWIWKMNCPLVFVAPFKVRVPDRTAAKVVKLYTPGARVRPARSVARVVVATRAAAAV